MNAAKDGHLQCVKSLLEIGADVNTTDQSNRYGLPFGNTFLACAAEDRHLQYVRALVNAGADVNEFNVLGISPLINAVMQDDEEMTRYLIQLGADVNLISTMFRRSALMWAAVRGSTNCIPILLDVGM